jgi:LysM domain
MTSPKLGHRTALRTQSAPQGPQHLIQRGDVLSELAKTWRVSVEDILKVNGQVKNRDLIYAGRTLTIPPNAKIDPPVAQLPASTATPPRDGMDAPVQPPKGPNLTGAAGAAPSPGQLAAPKGALTDKAIRSIMTSAIAQAQKTDPQVEAELEALVTQKKSAQDLSEKAKALLDKVSGEYAAQHPEVDPVGVQAAPVDPQVAEEPVGVVAQSETGRLEPGLELVKEEINSIDAAMSFGKAQGVDPKVLETLGLLKKVTITDDASALKTVSQEALLAAQQVRNAAQQQALVAKAKELLAGGDPKVLKVFEQLATAKDASVAKALKASDPESFKAVSSALKGAANALQPWTAWQRAGDDAIFQEAKPTVVDMANRRKDPAFTQTVSALMGVDTEAVATIDAKARRAGQEFIQRATQAHYAIKATELAMSQGEKADGPIAKGLAAFAAGVMNDAEMPSFKKLDPSVQAKVTEYLKLAYKAVVMPPQPTTAAPMPAGLKFAAAPAAPATAPAQKAAPGAAPAAPATSAPVSNTIE